VVLRSFWNRAKARHLLCILRFAIRASVFPRKCPARIFDSSRASGQVHYPQGTVARGWAWRSPAAGGVSGWPNVDGEHAWPGKHIPFVTPLKLAVDAHPAEVAGGLSRNCGGSHALRAGGTTTARIAGILERTLTRWQMRPVLAGSGQAGLIAVGEARSRGEPFAVILADGNMPGMDGFEFLERLGADPAVQNTILMLSWSGQTPEVKRKPGSRQSRPPDEPLAKPSCWKPF